MNTVSKKQQASRVLLMSALLVVIKCTAFNHLFFTTGYLQRSQDNFSSAAVHSKSITVYEKDCCD